MYIESMYRDVSVFLGAQYLRKIAIYGRIEKQVKNYHENKKIKFKISGYQEHMCNSLN